MEVGRSLDTLNQKIKETTQSIKQADAQVRSFDKALKMDPTNVDAVQKKYQALNASLTANTQKLQQLKQKQQALKSEYTSGGITQKQYEAQLIKVNAQIDKQTLKVNELTLAMQQENAAIRNAKLSKLTSDLTKAEQATSKLSKATLAVVAGLALVVKNAVSTSDELADLSQKYQTTAENLQIQANRYEQLTQSSDVYVTALQSVGSMMRSISAGRGARYLTYLKQLGITQADLADKSNAEVYDLIFEKLSQVEDATKRATIAQGLYGDAGLNVATVAGTEAEQLAALDEELLKQGIITSEQAAIGDQVANKLALLKSQYSAVAAELMVQMLPTIEALINVVKTSLLPILQSVASFLGSLSPAGQKILLILAAGVIVLPKVIALAKGLVAGLQAIKLATYGQAAAQATLNTVTAPYLPIIMAIGVALMAVITLIDSFCNKADDAASSAGSLLKSIDGVSEALGGEATGITIATENTTESNSHKTIDVNVNVEADGTTPVDQTAAENIGKTIYDQISIDLINQALGAQVR